MSDISMLSEPFLRNLLSCAVSKTQEDDKLARILDSIEVDKGDYNKLDFIIDKNMGELLILSAKKNNDKAVEILLKKMKDHELDINFTGNNNETALYIASYNGSDKVIERLINNGANPNIVNNEGNSPLIAAIKKGHYDIAKKIIDSKDVNLDIQDKNGDSALLLAIKDNEELAIKLIDKGANLEFKSGNNEAYHAIHCAAIYGASKVLQKIVDKNPNSINNKMIPYNITAIEIVMHCENRQLKDQMSKILQQPKSSPSQVIAKAINNTEIQKS